MQLRGEGDPGYGSTSRMLSEVALLQSETATEEGPGGVLTPASALFMALVPRLARAGVQISFPQP